MTGLAADRLQYRRFTRVRTWTVQDQSNQYDKLVGRAGLDPATLGLKVSPGASHGSSALTKSAC